MTESAFVKVTGEPDELKGSSPVRRGLVGKVLFAKAAVTRRLATLLAFVAVVAYRVCKVDSGL